MTGLARYQGDMNEQERFWAGEQGNAYISRNSGVDISARVAFWNRVIAWDEPAAPRSVIELGANIGLNLQAIRSIHTALDLTPPDLFAVEINETACEHLKAAGIRHECGSILDVDPQDPAHEAADLAFCMGVLIHIAPDHLPAAYAALDACSRRYVLMAEYYCPSPREIVYRGESERCWARDFCGEFMAQFPKKYRLVDYGFVYKRDPVAPLDDISWFLMEKSA